MLAGYNCTIFAYGQTGTGKTYTMSGDMTSTFGVPSDEAGIIPRILQNLFMKLELEDTENCVKVSFIELYNEELKDLLSADENAKLKIYDDNSKRGHASTIVQGMEEKHIQNAAEGIKVLQDGSLKRQVAATKCNDLSSRSHTVFTITAYAKKTNDQGVEDFVSAGKLNLVDLAGSENIQRSGAENKRAAEAGLINKSLLTLGRVINALVDRSSHIPYRESKLTRLLQDSLGGRTKTCIIATISPAKSNLEETISTLDYAFRAKNIKNKPQLNPMLNKKMLLKDFTIEIEKLKSELISTRQRNGVYLSNDAYEEMTAQSETRRIVNEELAAKIDTLETNLRNKVQELFTLNLTFMGIRKDHEGTKAQLDEAKGVLDQTEIVLSATRKSLEDETRIRQAHEETEEKLTEIGGQLISKLGKTVHDVTGLHAKNKRKSDLQSLNRAAWNTSQCQVADVTSMIERRVQEFQEEQQEHVSSVSRRMADFVSEELAKLSTNQAFMDEQLDAFLASKKQLLEQRQKSKDEMDEVLEEIKIVRDGVKEQIATRLLAISEADEKNTTDVLSDMTNFHTQLHTSYSNLGKDSKSIIEEIIKRLTAQKGENDELHRQLQAAQNTIKLLTMNHSAQMQEAFEAGRRKADEARQQLIALINSQAADANAYAASHNERVSTYKIETQAALDKFAIDVRSLKDSREEKDEEFLKYVKQSRDQIKTNLKDDWNNANDSSTSVQNKIKSVHAERTKLAEEQVENLQGQMEALDDFVTRAKTENTRQHEAHTQGATVMSSSVEQSMSNISAHFKTTFDRVRVLGEEMELDTTDLQDGLEPLDVQVCRPLSNLREEITGSQLQEYQPTGETPRKMQYEYPTTLPRTAAHDIITTKVDEGCEPDDEVDTMVEQQDNTVVFADLTIPRMSSSPQQERCHTTNLTGLREVDPNTTATNLTGNFTTGALNFDAEKIVSTPVDEVAPLSKQRSIRPPQGLKRPAVVVEGRENMPPPPTAIGRGPTKRKSPRLK